MCPSLIILISHGFLLLKIIVSLCHLTYINLKVLKHTGFDECFHLFTCCMKCETEHTHLTFYTTAWEYLHMFSNIESLTTYSVVESHRMQENPCSQLLNINIAKKKQAMSPTFINIMTCSVGYIWLVIWARGAMTSPILQLVHCNEQ